MPSHTLCLLLLLLPSFSATYLPYKIRVGLTWETCASDSDCMSPRKCLSESGLFECRSGEICICYPEDPELCTPSTTCSNGESCASRNGEPAFCVADAVISSDPEFVPAQGTNNSTDTGGFPSLDQPTSSFSPSLPAAPISTSPAAPTSPSSVPTSSPPTPTSPSDPAPSSPPPAPTSPPPADSSSPPPPDSSPPPPPNSSSLPPPDSSSPPPPAPASPSTGLAPTSPSSPEASTPSSAPPSAAPNTSSPAPSDPTSSPAGTLSPTSSTLPSPSGVPQPTITPSPATTTTGLAGDPCTSDGDCLTYRNCLDVDTFEECQAGQTCRCLGSRICTCDDDCTDGELCSGPQGRSYCFSSSFLNSLSWATNIPCAGSSPATTPPVMLGLTGDVCRSNENCMLPRTCRAGGGNNCALDEILCESAQISCSDADEVCYCYAVTTCNCTGDCNDGEVCTEIPAGKLCVSNGILQESGWLNEIPCVEESDDPNIVDVPLPVSPEAGVSGVVEVTPTSLPENSDSEGSGDEPVCVDAEALAGLDLVFEKHVMASVLCDKFGSCATKGHIVAYHGRPMMMRSYCDLVGCVRKVLLVNSPVRRRGLRVQSRTEGLEYTAFAARFGTRVEEVLLSAAVKIGM